MMESVASGMLASVSDARDMVPRWVGERRTSTDSGVVNPSLDNAGIFILAPFLFLKKYGTGQKFSFTV